LSPKFAVQSETVDEVSKRRSLHDDQLSRPARVGRPPRLSSSGRPTYWRRENYDSQNYDWNALGWVWQELDYGQSDAPIGEAKHIYDTPILGHDNGGHIFGDHLSDDERAAVLEYLESI